MGLAISIRADFAMATNKERIENLEVGLRGLQDSMSWMELGIVEKCYQFVKKKRNARTTTPMTIVVNFATIKMNL